MRFDPSLLWTWYRSIDRVPYLVTGVVLFAIKYAIDGVVANWVFHRDWSPMNYLVWPNDHTVTVFRLGDPEREFALTMLLISLPFIWTGVILTLHRLRAAGLPLTLVVLFFVPVVNLLLFAVLAVLPTRALTVVSAGPDPLERAHRRLTGDSYWRSGLLSVLITVPLSVLGIVLGANVLESYGFSLFVGLPFALGMISVILFGFSRPKPLGWCLLVAACSTFLAGFVVVLVALEGVICLIMAAPIAMGLAFIGALIGYAIQARPWLNSWTVQVALTLILTLPALMAAESVNEPAPELREVCTVVEVDAPPEVVWGYVIAFPPLAEPDDWFFRTGVAYPHRAEIEGAGPGAVRYCVFSTGAFVEPIDVWDAPHLLRFDVTEQPVPMREWSPYAIHPPHLDHYLNSRRGQFKLERLPDGRTRLEGTTWYTNRMWPQRYWGLWSDYIIHRIHGRVLEHVKQLAESR